ncbi:hypothetical protein ACJMK2_015449 [Sinanodonta woodiana]|uniref:Uncharacterized protein n=1 Tax=Sinanodonta woodiana TaxID=1069815 RepID=A0ABD3UTN0_SINWO
MDSTSFLGSPLRPTVGKPPLSQLAQSLPKLTKETELQKLLADEKMRSQMHKTNFMQLKEEHKRLQEENAQLEEEIRRTVEESKIVQEKYKSLYEESRKELADKHTMIEEYRNKVLTPQRFEVIQMQIRDELENAYREKMQRKEMEMEEYRKLNNSMKQELNFVKSEYEHSRIESQRLVEELKLQYDAEVSNLRKEREVTINRIYAEGKNAQLHLKIKGLISEIEEVRAEREKCEMDYETVTRTHNKQITEQLASLKSLEAERESLRKQVENLQRDMTGSTDSYNKLLGKLHDLEKENMVLKNRADEVQHKSKLDVTNLKMDMLKQRGDLERDRDKLSNVIDDLRTKLDITKHNIQQQEQMLVEKEREAVRRVQAAREEEFAKFSEVENEKLELETKLHEIERRKMDEEAHRQAERERMEEKIRAAHEVKDTAEKELLVYKTKLAHQQSLMDQLDRERSENSELKSKVAKLEMDLNQYLGSEHDITDNNIRLRNQNELLREELKLTKEQYNKAHDNHERILAQCKAANADENTQLEMRVHELEEKLSQVNKKYNKAVLIYKKLKKRSSKVIENLKDQHQIMEAKMEELELEKKTLAACVPQDTYKNLQKQWKELFRRHSQFRHIICSGALQQVPIGDMSFASVTLPMDASAFANYSFNDQERKHQEDLRILRQKLDLLDDNQKQQLEDLQEVAHSTFKNTLPEYDDIDGIEKTDLEKNSTSTSPVPS